MVLLTSIQNTCQKIIYNEIKSQTIIYILCTFEVITLNFYE